ncbi:unnamed protein product [Notodromas monacha]|uniref:LIM/homeobox protein Awh n=1 Tax=Notodromas monacha TaxID=399045 RepID=A0A7R9BWJ0_9CRUS|nr:unnamed protein product [Notodromas monacha]CAG0921910.1 unnamed protein product [Notodromas monacha]
MDRRLRSQVLQQLLQNPGYDAAGVLLLPRPGNLVRMRGLVLRTFGARCAKCGRGINTTDWVRRARDQVYHLACFACEACKRQLSTGEEFALHQNQVLCKTHYLETVDGGNSSYDVQLSLDNVSLLVFFSEILSTESGDGESGGSGANGSSGGSGKSKAKRVRTTFTDEQLQVLQANFQLDSNPDGQDLERIAQITGLSKRVTQVWFQNSRARQKKHMHQMTKVGGNNKVGSNGIPHGVVMQGADFQQVNEMNNRSEQSQSMDTSEDTSNSGMTVIYSFG